MDTLELVDLDDGFAGAAAAAADAAFDVDVVVVVVVAVVALPRQNPIIIPTSNGPAINTAGLAL